MNSAFKIARTAGLLYLLYVITSVIANLFGKFVFVEAPVTVNHILTHAFQFHIGFVINLWTDRLFKMDKTTVKPFERPTYLEISGPFRISRHPMYLGMLAILLGTAVVLGSVACFIPPLLFLIAMEIFYIPREESNLEKVFGETYLDYKNRVRKWI